MHPREKVLGKIKYHQRHGEPIPEDTLREAEAWGVLIPDHQNSGTKPKEDKGEPNGSKS